MDLPSFPQWPVIPTVANRAELSETQSWTVLLRLLQLSLIGVLILLITIPVWWPPLMFWDP
jgi:hypothetical protein